MAQNLKILLIHRYFWPDTPPYAIILKKIAARLVEDGHNIDVLSTQPAYKPDANIAKQKCIETIDGYTVRRLALLPESGKILNTLNMFLFSFRVLVYTLQNRKYDVIMISTSPPILAGLVARISAKLCNAKLLYHCMDIHPEIGKISGEFSNKWLFNFLQETDSKTCRYAERVIVLSEDMKDAILERGNNEKCRIDVIQNFNLNEKIEQTIIHDEKFTKKEDVFRLIFAGNIGRFQGLDILVDAFLELNNLENIELVFLGEGKMKSKLKEKVAKAGAKNIRFIPHQPVEVANKIIKTADLGIVSLSPGIYRYAYPTKIIAYLSVGCPLLVMVESESALASFIKTNQIGINIDLNDKLALKSIINDLNKDRKAFAEMRKNAILTYEKFYNETLVLDKWSSLFKAI